MKKIGHVKDAHGLKGELAIHVPSEDVSWCEELKICELEDPKTLKKNLHQVEFAKPFKSGLRIRLSGISDRTQAESLRGWNFLIDEALLVSDAGETIFLSEILGFQVRQENPSHLWGEITGFSSNGMQDLLQIKNEKGTFEAPFVEAFIVRLDFENRCVYMNLPPGLQD